MDELPDRINAAALLLARGRPAQPALVCCGRTMPYGELRKAVARAATSWQERGVAPGDLVLLLGNHGLEHVIAFLGAMWAGGVPVPLRSARQAPDGEGRAPRGPVHYRLDGAPGAAAAAAGGAGEGDWAEWQDDLRNAPPAPAVPCPLAAPACCTDRRGRDGRGARVLPQRFALALTARPGTLPLARAATMLAVLRALRRGVTAVLQPGLAPAPGKAVPT